MTGGHVVEHAKPHPAPRVVLRARGADWDILTRHLFPGDGDEHGAALLCGTVRFGDELRLLVREVVVAVDGVDYVPGTRGYRHLTGAFVTRALRRAEESGLVYLAVHNHGGTSHVAFSKPDLDSHERGYPTLLSLNGSPVGALVLAKGAIAGDIWMMDGTRAALAVAVVGGDAMTVMTDGFRETVDDLGLVPEAYARQALLFGATGQSRLRRMRVAIVGAGGVGMLLVQSITRLGVGELVVVDPDVVTTSNLSRLPEARPFDAQGRFGAGLIGRAARRLRLNQPTPKVELATRIASRAGTAVKVLPLQRDVADDDVARQLLGCDFIFLAADTMLARLVVNQIAYQYLIPTLQVGSKVVIDPETGQVLDVFGVVRSIGSAPGCLLCNGVINMAKLAEEAVATQEQRNNQRYVDDPEVHAPSVITLNSMSAGWAANDFMHYATGLGRPSDGYRILRSRPVSEDALQLVVQDPHVNPDCRVCGVTVHSVASVGDGPDLPTRLSPATNRMP